MEEVEINILRATRELNQLRQDSINDHVKRLIKSFLLTALGLVGIWISRFYLDYEVSSTLFDLLVIYTGMSFSLCMVEMWGLRQVSLIYTEQMRLFNSEMDQILEQLDTE